jgi:hypothetical protein
MLQNLLPKNLPNLQNNPELKKELNLISENLTKDNYTPQQKNEMLNRLIILTVVTSSILLALTYLNFTNSSQAGPLNEKIQNINNKYESINLEITNLEESSLKLSQYENAKLSKISRKDFFFFLSNISRILQNEVVVLYDYTHEIGSTNFKIIYNSDNQDTENQIKDFIQKNSKIKNFKSNSVEFEGKTLQYTIEGVYDER